ncbi:putative protein LONGIFOLIA [Helianthus debilis subsp. tardiflorus]
MMTRLIQDQNLEKQIEKQIVCMSGFLYNFDRQQILTGKRISSTKCLPSSTFCHVSNRMKLFSFDMNPTVDDVTGLAA